MTDVEQGDHEALLSSFRCAIRSGLDIEVQARSHHVLTRRLLELFAQVGVGWISVPFDEAFRRPSEGADPGFLETVRSLGIDVEVRTDLHDGVVSEIESLCQGAGRWVVRVELEASAQSTQPAEQQLTELATWAATSSERVTVHYAPFFLRLCGAVRLLHPCRARDERNGLCITETGEIVPDPAIPLPVGHVQTDCLSTLFDEHPLLRALRDPDAVEGKCGTCEFRTICGGSRARALAQTGNLFASDPACTYGL
jgi:radical SAM protein with 4Fe4S-binding SPASM domain